MRLCALLLTTLCCGAAGPFTLEQVTSYPFPSELAAAPTGSRLAWALNEQGKRNIWEAEAPEWRARKLTHYDSDDGQELDNVSLSQDGKFIIYTRGGDHDANWPVEQNLAPDPVSAPHQPKIEIFAVPFAGGEPKLLAEGDQPVISSRGIVAFARDHAIWTVPVDGSVTAKKLFFARGDNFDTRHEVNAPVWSTDGSKLAFVSVRDDHSLIGIFSDESKPIIWLEPSTNFDVLPRWSQNGKQIAFIRTAGSGGAPKSILEQHPQPWFIWIADIESGKGREIWHSPQTLRGSFPASLAVLGWGASDRLIFAADLDGWSHPYSIATAGGEPLLLTPGRGIAEHVTVSPDRRSVVFSGNMGKGADDIDRRHIFRAAVDKVAVEELTPGDGIEWKPFVTGDGQSIAFISAGAKRPPGVKVIPASGPALLHAETIPADFPTDSLLVPKAVTFHASDGLEIHGQLFESADGAAKKPAIVFVHGGPPRQMLLGWHYMSYYSNAYALNQYLASRGYVVLSVNYRLGIGYGHEFHHPDHAGPRGASEYLDVKAAGEYLRKLPQVDPKRIGIWGGSYGGFLTAMALAHDSDLFAAGVDMHGVHDWLSDSRLPDDKFEKAPDYDEAAKVYWQSSPVSSISTWKSPVLLIHGDDDRNVRFHQTVDLARRLEAAHLQFEQMIIPDEIHGFLRHASWLKVDRATVDFFDKTIGRHSSQ